MTGQLDQISEAIGALRSEVGGLRRDFQEAERRQMASTQRADQHRSAIHKRVDDLVDEVGEVKTKVEVVTTDVADAKAVTDKVKMWEQRGVGALFVAGIAGTAVGGSAVAFLAYWWEAIIRALRAG